MPPNIALFGFMGVGKTVVGKLLAEKTGFTYIDIDEEIVNRKGKTIPLIFSEEGETSFRAIEKQVTRDIASNRGQIIACGGGTVLKPENRDSLRSSSSMVLLTADPQIILQRVEAEGETRPLLMVDDKINKIRNLLADRNPKYVEAADLIVDTSDITPDEVVEEILKNLEWDLI